MTFSREWNTAHKNGQRGLGDTGISAQLGLLLQNFIGHLPGQRLLDLGCGTGKAAQVLVPAGVDYHGIDGRDWAVEMAQKEVPEGKFACTDFTHEQPFEGEFDVVMDRASVPHNDLPGIRRCVNLIWRSLKPGGLYISSDWFSSHHSEVWRGEVVDDMTRTNYPDGQFQGVGRVHFSSEQELLRLFEPFERCWLEERITRRPLRGGFVASDSDPPWVSPFYFGREYQSAVWDLMVRKPR